MRNTSFSALVVSVLTAAGCASSPTYSPPQSAAPAQWRGQASLAIGTDEAVLTGELANPPNAKGPVHPLVQTRVNPARMGELAAEVTGVEPDGTPFLIPAGTQAFAIQLSMISSDQFGNSSVNLNERNDPIEWCFIRPAERTVCAFWQSADQVLYLESVSDVKGWVRQVEKNGVLAQVPQIVERDPTLTPDLFLEIGANFNLSSAVVCRQIAQRNEDTPKLAYHPLRDCRSTDWNQNGDASVSFEGFEFEFSTGLELRPQTMMERVQGQGPYLSQHPRKVEVSVTRRP